MSASAGRPLLNGICETSLYVRDLGASARFYTAVLGFAPIMRDHRMAALAVAPNQVLLLFVQGGSVTPTPAPNGHIPPHDAHGRQHVCFSVPRQALDGWQAWLRDSGIAVESRLDWPNGGSSVYFRDPDDHSVEVATSGLWPNF